MSQGRRLRSEFVGPNSHVLCICAVTPAVDVAEHFVPDSDPLRIRPDRVDDARNLVARDDGWRAGRAIVMQPCTAPVELTRADATSVDMDQDFGGAEGRDRRILVDQLRR